MYPRLLLAVTLASSTQAFAQENAQASAPGFLEGSTLDLNLRRRWW